MTKKSATPSTMALWERLCATDPQYTKPFTKNGGFSGTAINNQYLTMRMTEMFGPVGVGWGYEIADENYITGHAILNGEGQKIGETIIHVVRLRLWYKDPGSSEVGSCEHFGQTTFVGKNKYGMFTDEEAPKKSVTDALAKCMSMLGLAADVYLGEYDDNKYISGKTDNGRSAPKAKSRDNFDQLTKSMRACKTTVDMGHWYKANEDAISSLPPDWVTHLREAYRTMHLELLGQEQSPPKTELERAADDYEEMARVAEEFEKTQQENADA